MLVTMTRWPDPDAFVGAVLDATVGTSVLQFYLVAKALKLKDSRHSSSSATVDRVSRSRERSELLKAMNTLQTETPKSSFGLGLILFLLSPCTSKDRGAGPSMCWLVFRHHGGRFVVGDPCLL
jgi:hypothetical protein